MRTRKKKKTSKPECLRVLVTRGDDVQVFDVTASGVDCEDVRRAMRAFVRSLIDGDQGVEKPRDGVRLRGRRVRRFLNLLT
jgi:hypothetical protein